MNGSILILQLAVYGSLQKNTKLHISPVYYDLLITSLFVHKCIGFVDLVAS